VLDEQGKSQGKLPLKKRIKFPFVTNPLRKLLTLFRTVENVNVKTLAHDENSTQISLNNILPGDFLVICNSGYAGTIDHVMLIKSVDYKDETLQIPTTLHLVHSFQWGSDGINKHGARESTIKVIDVNKNILEQEWQEQGKTGLENETYKRATEAEKIELRRLKI
jgi:hypothetical protein